MFPLRLTDDQCSSISDISEWPIVSNTLEDFPIKHFENIVGEFGKLLDGRLYIKHFENIVAEFGKLLNGRL